MLLHQMHLSLPALTTILLARPITAAFIPDLLRSFDDLQDVRKRCDNPCGYYGQLCCEEGESCYTDANDQAQCGPGQVTQATTAAAGSWEYYTTTYVQTDLKTVTATFSSFIAQSTLSCAYSLGESACGNVCCLSGQFCQATGQCVAVGGGSSGYYSSLYTVTTVVTNTASVPSRPTSNTLVTVTPGTTTQPFETPVGTNGAIIYGPTASGSGGLSGGAIAGIVIGVIAGVILLLLLCACLCFKGLIDGILAIFGLGKKRKRTEEEVYVERHSHRSGRSGVHNNRRTWFGTRPARTDVVEEKKSSGIGRAGWVAATLGGLALFLGMKRRNRKDDKSSSGYGSSYYSDYTVSSSESSSDRRTRRSSHHSRSRSRR
ncbi:uncharacterized protein A1O9_11191 [Exophiala aquamarina CBS 119918]|uniref:Mid2 domain-containing protein n=1 Tax=Exophiala aquamarina CBS 119918 TaxID=1182545 RepID=A0A072NY52_9EURO|nr:uncharacterized protein A1O9_11191 [Exophiala aquamarina CBS 119918]KEF52774.1 hypothetical protein A1O9_11191 [Exophiala aquamarina CBS 119918]